MSTLNRTALRELAGKAAIPDVVTPDFALGAKPARLFDEVRQVCGAFEWVTFAYLTWVNAIVILFHRNIAHAARHFGIHLAIGVGIACLAWEAARSRDSILQFARHWYPLPLYIFFFEELQGLVHAIVPGWFDRWLIAFDFDFAGVHPSVWLAQFASPALNDFMQFAYMTYFLYLVILPGILYTQRDLIAFWTVMVSTAIAHYAVYVIAILFPIESPFYSLASLQTKALDGGYFTAAIELIERFGRVHGAAFPSAHVAGSMVAILASWRYRRWLFWICLPFFASMCVGTVYGRYHYIADVLAGIVVGAIAFVAGSRLMQRNGSLGNRQFPIGALPTRSDSSHAICHTFRRNVGVCPNPENIYEQKVEAPRVDKVAECKSLSFSSKPS